LQEYIDINSVSIDVTDIDLCGTCLGGIIPNYITVTGIAAGGTGIR
jgi:hypothetical protein